MATRKDDDSAREAPAPRVQEPPPEVGKKDQDKFDALVKEKRASGLPLEDAQLVARRQIAEDNLNK